MARMRMLILCTAAVALLAACNRMTPEERLEKMTEAMQQGDALSAELEAKKIVEKYPDDPAAITARIRLAQLYTRDGRLDEAASEYQALLDKIPPSSSEGIRILSMYNDILKRQQRYPEALALLDRYEKELTTSPEVALNLKVARADIKTGAGQTTEARTLLEELTKSTTNTLAQLQFRQLYLQTFARDKNTTGAIQYLEHEIASPVSEQVRHSLVLQLAGLQADLGNYGEARRWVEEATRQADESLKNELDLNAQTQTLFELARLYEETGNLEGARAVLMRLYQVNRDPAFGPYVVPEIFRLLLRQGKQEEALAFLREAQKRYSDPQLAQEVVRVEDAAKAGKLDKPDTSPLVLKFAAEPPIVPANLPEASAEATTGTMTAAKPTTGSETTTGSSPEKAPSAAAPKSTTPAESSNETTGSK